MKNSYLQRVGQFALTVCLPLTTPAARETIVLVNGTSLVGDVTAGPNGKLVIKDSVLGVLTIDANAVKTRHAADGAAEKPPVVPTAGKPPTDPNKVVWTRGLQLNYSYISGAAPALGVGSSTNFGANLAIERAARKDIVSFTASYNRGHNRPGPVSVNNRTFGLHYDHLYSEKVRFISQSTFLVDHPHKIDRSFKQLAAVGYTFVKSPKAFLLVAPGLGYTDQKESVGSAEKDFGYGAYETASYAFTKALSIEQRAYYLGAFDTADSYHYTGYLGLKGQVTPSVAMTIGFNIVHDNQPAPGIEKTDYQLMSGLQLKF